MSSTEVKTRLLSLSVLFKVMGLAGVVIGVLSLVVWTMLIVSNVIFVLPPMTRAAARGVEIIPSALLPFLLSPLGILRAVLLLFAARALLKEKPSAQKWALRYGIVALVTIPPETYLLNIDAVISISNSAGILGSIGLRLLLPLGFIAYAIYGTRPNRSAQNDSAA